ncbi:MAG: zinc-ribbon domain-containing protein, partial [Myxococcales bacterium]|nr:zinc-ribbon domain-containing protein [Myxococcales bacterium]
MIITCEQCETRFQLDDERVPAKGAKVRCSRCRHAFYVKPTARRGDPVEDAVDQALSRDAEAPPSGSTEPLNPAAALQPDGLDALANTANPEPNDRDAS